MKFKKKSLEKHVIYRLMEKAMLGACSAIGSKWLRITNIVFQS